MTGCIVELAVFGKNRRLSRWSDRRMRTVWNEIKDGLISLPTRCSNSSGAVAEEILDLRAAILRYRKKTYKIEEVCWNPKRFQSLRRTTCALYIQPQVTFRLRVTSTNTQGLHASNRGFAGGDVWGVPSSDKKNLCKKYSKKFSQK